MPFISSKFGQAIVANSTKQTVSKQQLRDRLRAKLGKPSIDHEIQQFQVEGGDERSKFIFAYMDIHGVKYEEAAKAYEEGVRYWLGLN